MVEVEVNGTTVTVDVVGAHQLFALRDHLTFDRANIRSITAAEVDLRPPWFRTPGTFFPGVIAAGTFRGKGRKEFWDTMFDGRGVRIELVGTDFTRIVVDVVDVDSVVRNLSQAAAA